MVFLILNSFFETSDGFNNFFVGKSWNHLRKLMVSWVKFGQKLLNEWFQDFPKKRKKNVETIRGFKKTVQNQKYPSRVMKKLCNLTKFFISVPSYFWFWTVFLKPRMVSTFFLGKSRKINRYLMRFVVNVLLFKAKP